MMPNDPYDPQFGPYHSQPAPYASYAPQQQAPGPQPQLSGRPARRRGWWVAAGTAVVAAAVIGGVAVANTGSVTIAGSGSAAQLAPRGQGSGPANPGPANPGGANPGGANPGGANPGTGGTGRSGTGTAAHVALATRAQQQGIVTIVAVLKYQNAESAGTGMVLSPDGEILTNNHVINGATSVTVTVETTGRSYRGDVVGTDASRDVAVVQLRRAAGLTTAKIGDSSGVVTGDSIVGVGNAGGSGVLRASSGKVTGLARTITATDRSGGAGEKLHGLIEVNAPIISGDSGGPMYDAAGSIIGMNTAASATAATQKTAYAIPIDSAESIAAKIESGVETSTIHIGAPAFLGVSVTNTSRSGAAVTAVLPGGPAATAGITGGSVITSVGGKKIGSSTALKQVMNGRQPGSRVRVGWTAADGSTHSATVTPVAGPAD